MKSITNILTLTLGEVTTGEVAHGKAVESTTKKLRTEKQVIDDTADAIDNKETEVDETKAAARAASLEAIEDETAYTKRVMLSIEAIQLKKKALGEDSIDIKKDSMYGFLNAVGSEDTTRDIVQRYLQSKGYEGEYSQIPTMKIENLKRQKFTGGDIDKAQRLSNVFRAITGQAHDVERGKITRVKLGDKEGVKELVDFLNNNPDVQSNIDQTTKKTKGLKEQVKETSDSLDDMGDNKRDPFKNLKDRASDFTAALKLIPPQAWVVIGVIAAIAATAAIAYSVATAEERHLKKAVEETTEALTKAREEYENLNKTISDYKDSKDAIKELTDGTVEFYAAIEASNAKALELIETLGLLRDVDYTVDSNGLISIDEKVLEKELFQQLQNTYRKQGDNFSAQAELEKFNQEKLVKKFRDAVNRDAMLQGVDSSIDVDQARAILENSKKENYNIGKTDYVQRGPERTEITAYDANSNPLLEDAINNNTDVIAEAVHQSSVDISATLDEFVPLFNSSQSRVDN